MCTGRHAFIPATNVVRTEMIYSQLGEVAENVLHFAFTAAPSISSMQQFGDALITSWAANMKPIQSLSVSLDLIRLTDLNSDSGPVVERTTGLPQAGGDSTPVKSTGWSLATKFSGDGRGRSRRGRAFFVGLNSFRVNDNRVTDAFAQTLSDVWLGMIADAIDDFGDGLHVIVSYCSEGAWRSDALVTNVTGYSTEPYIDSMRRRLHGRGV